MRSLLLLLCLGALAACDCGNPKITTAFDAGCKPETCNGTDDDCDGVVDNGLTVLRCGVGACARTMSSCANGALQTCESGAPALETCNGLDDDCNGEVDDNLAPVTCGVGECATTMPSCAAGEAQACVPGLPGAEHCDGRDNDCDGEVDEELPLATCGQGACARAVPSCVDGQEQSCEPGLPSTEVCDGVDNNCDGQLDEDLPALSCGLGECARSQPACVSGLGQVCTPGASIAERCDGKDNDCDGQIDNGLGPVTCGVGACQRTVASCVSGVPRACVEGAPVAEFCDGIDNDCDGRIDEDGICNPPIVLCSGATSATVGTGVTLTATALDIDGTIVSNQWIVAIRPAGSTAFPTPANQPTTVFTPDVAGNYTLAFCARDNAGTTTCCSTSISTTVCTSPPSPPVSTACGTSWDGRPIVQFPEVPAGLTYQLKLAGDPLVRASATVGQNYLRPVQRLAPGGPPPGLSTALEVRACQSSDLSCCSAPAAVTVDVVEACTTPAAASASNLVLSEYVVNGQPGPCPSSTTCQSGEAIELTNLSNCPVSLDGFHFAYRNDNASPGSYRWMNFGPTDVIPPRGVYVAIRNRAFAPICAASLNQTAQSAGLFGLKVSSLEMQGPSLDNGWFVNGGGGQSVLQVSAGTVPATGLTASDFAAPLAEVAPYQGGNGVCVGVGFDAVSTCGNFVGSSTPTTPVNPNQLGRLWHPCDVLGGTGVPTCVRN